MLEVKFDVKKKVLSWRSWVKSLLFYNMEKTLLKLLDYSFKIFSGRVLKGIYLIYN